MSKIQSNVIFLVIFFAILLAAARLVKPFAHEGRVVTSFEGIPKTIGSWTGVDRQFDEEVKKQLPGSSLLWRDYTDRDGNIVSIAIVYGTALGIFHQPEMCLQGSGWTILDEGDTKIPVNSGTSITAKYFVMENEYVGKSAGVYWFSTRGMTSTFLGTHKTQLYLYRILRRKIEPSALVRFTSMVQSDDATTLKKVKELAGLLFPYVQEELKK
ncbi:MAG: EpsI family protein [Armatimonadetes bacterium]|nr:EpsI family protein [Armatimonadota bacterium]